MSVLLVHCFLRIFRFKHSSWLWKFCPNCRVWAAIGCQCCRRTNRAVIWFCCRLPNGPFCSIAPKWWSMPSRYALNALTTIYHTHSNQLTYVALSLTEPPDQRNERWHTGQSTNFAAARLAHRKGSGRINIRANIQQRPIHVSAFHQIHHVHRFHRRVHVHLHARQWCAAGIHAATNEFGHTTHWHAWRWQRGQGRFQTIIETTSNTQQRQHRESDRAVYHTRACGIAGKYFRQIDRERSVCTLYGGWQPECIDSIPFILCPCSIRYTYFVFLSE